MFKKKSKTSDKDKKVHSIYELEPIFEDNLIVNKDGRVAIGFKVDGLQFQSNTPGDFSNINNQVCNAIEILPENAVVQYMDVYYELPFKGNKNGEHYLDRKANEYFNNRLMLVHKAYLFISFPIREGEAKALPMRTLFSTLGTGVKNPYENIEDRMAEAEKLGFSFTQTLMGNIGGLQFSRLSDAENQNLYYQYFNFEFYEPVNDYHKSISSHSNHVSIGEKNINLVRIGRQGDEWFTSQKDYFGVTGPYSYPLTEGLYFPHLTITSIWVEDTEKVLGSIDFERKLNAGISGQIGGGQDNQVKETELENFTRLIRTEKTPLVSLNVSVLIPSNDEYQKEERLRLTKSAIASISKAKPYVESIDTANLFFGLAPGNAGDNYRWLTAELPNAAAYLHFTTAIYPDKRGYLLCDRYGNPTIADMFDEDGDGQNAQIVGPTGSGKSATAAGFIIQGYIKGERQIVIEKGATYKNTFEFLGMPYYEYDPDKPLALNPFDIDKDATPGYAGLIKYKLTVLKQEYLVSFITLIWKGKGIRLNPSEKSVLMSLLTDYYDSLNPGDLANIMGFYHFTQAYIKRGEEEDTKEYQEFKEGLNFKQFILAMRPFAVGEYKDICNAEENMDITQYELVGFDLLRVEKNETLFPIITLMLTELTTDMIKKYPTVIKKVYLDECWSFLETLDKYMDELYRTFRKAKGSIWTISQSVLEFKNSSIAAALRANSAYKIILKHEGKENMVRTDVAEYFELTDNEVEMILSLIKLPEFREVAIKKGEVMKVYRIEFPPEIMAIVTSKPKERDVFNAIKKAKKGNIMHALREYMEHVYLRKDVTYDN